MQRILLLFLLTGAVAFLPAQSPSFTQTFESLATGQQNIPYFYEQNCAVAPCDRCDTNPIYVTGEQSRAGWKGLRMNRRYKDAALTGGSYCGYRNEIGNYNDAFIDYNEHTWVGFSVYIADNYLADRWSGDNVHVFQVKNIDAGGGGNQYGSLITHNTSAGNYLEVAGLGDVTPTRLNTWIDVEMHLYYNTSGSGVIEVWIDNVYKKKTNVSFPAKQACYLKFGTYSDRLDSSDPTHKVYYDEMRWYTASNGGNYRHVVRPNGNNSKENNVARGKSVSTSGSQSGYGGNKLVDGYTNGNSRWSAKGFSKSATIDLWSNHRISAVELFPYSNRAYRYTVQTSTNNQDWTTVVNRSSNTQGGGALLNNFSERTARYVRVTVTGASGYSGSWVSLRELKVYGKPGGGGGGGGGSSSTTLNPVADAMVRSASSGTNFGGESSSLLQPKASDKREAYLRFDLSGVGNNVSSAKLRFYTSPWSNSQGTTVSVDVRKVSNDSWNEYGITWNNRPGTNYLTGSKTAAEWGYTEFDVTNYVNAEASGDDKASFLVRVTNSWTSPYDMRTNIWMRESNQKPQLVITSSNSRPAATSPPTPVTLTPAEQSAADLDFNVFPNPTRGNGVSLTLPAAARGNLEVRNVSGQLLYRVRVDQPWINEPLNFRFPQSGVYLIRLRNGEAAAVKRVVVP